MSSKDKVKLVRGEDFDLVDQELTEAMSLVDAANERVVQLLTEEREGPAPEAEDEILFGEGPARKEGAEAPPAPDQQEKAE